MEQGTNNFNQDNFNNQNNTGMINNQSLNNQNFNNTFNQNTNVGESLYSQQSTIEPISQVQTQNFNTYQQPVQPPKKSKIGLIVAIILAIVAIISGILLFSNLNKKSPIKDENTNNSEVQNNGQQNSGLGSSSDLIEKEYTGSKRNLIVATVGHINHGKTTLTSAITKFYGKYKTVDQINRAPEIKKNGLVYNASFVEYETSTTHYSHYDMLGHNDIIKAITSGNVRLDGAILVVSATDGIMHQTREHLYLLQQAGVDKIVVYMSKCDMVDDDFMLQLMEMEIMEALEKYGFDGENTPIIKGSALKALEGDKDGESSISELINSMDTWFTKRSYTEKASLNTKFNAHIYILTKEEGGRKTPFFNEHNAQISISSAKDNGIITFPEGIDLVMPGDNIYNTTITLSKAISFKKGDSFQILEDDKLIGVGIVESVE